MADLSDNRWNEQANLNTSPVPDGFPNGSAPSTIYALTREDRASTKRFWKRINSIVTSTGAANAYVLAYDSVPDNQVNGEWFSFFAHADNTGPATLKINSLPTKTLLDSNGVALVAGAIKAGCSYTAEYKDTGYRLRGMSINNPAFKGSASFENGAFTGTLSQDGQRVLTLADLGTGKGLDADKLDGQDGSWYLERANHTGTQPVTTITGLDAILDDPWRFQPVGSLVYATWLSGFIPPPTDKAYRYIILSAGSAYNAGVLTDETVTGTGAATVATAKINLPASPFHGQTVRLINTTREFLRPGAPGAIQASQNKSHSHSGQTNVTGNHVHSYIQPAPGYAVGNINGTGSGGAWTTTGAAGDHAHTLIINAEGGEEAQPRSIGANVYMRIL